MLEATPVRSQVMRHHRTHPLHLPNAMQNLWQMVICGLVLITLIALVRVLFTHPHFTAAQASQDVSFRVSRLETESRMVQSRLNQLEAQIRQLGRPSGGQDRNPPPPPPTMSDFSLTAGDPMFDRLATLVIETRQDVFALQEQVNELASQLHQPEDGL